MQKFWSELEIMQPTPKSTYDDCCDGSSDMSSLSSVAPRDICRQSTVESASIDIGAYMAHETCMEVTRLGSIATLVGSTTWSISDNVLLASCNTSSDLSLRTL